MSDKVRETDVDGTTMYNVKNILALASVPIKEVHNFVTVVKTSISYSIAFEKRRMDEFGKKLGATLTIVKMAPSFGEKSEMFCDRESAVCAVLAAIFSKRLHRVIPPARR